MDTNQYATRWRQAAHAPSGIIGNTRAAIRSSALSALALMNRSVGDSFLRCLYCHYVFDDQREEFERLILDLKSCGRFVDTQTCVGMLRGGVPVEGRNFHLSFDDGFRNNFTNAFPILKNLGVPAVFFIPSALMDADWNRAKRYCLETTGYGGVIELMGWKDLAGMSAAGYDIGSHTRTHSRFSVISRDPAAMEDEILGSKNEIESRLGIKCRYISWPFGRAEDADSASLEMTKRAGYEACFGAFRGTVRPGATDPFRIPRHHFEAQWPLSHIKYFARGNMEPA